jgi:hypothetical protein
MLNKMYFIETGRIDIYVSAVRIPAVHPSYIFINLLQIYTISHSKGIKFSNCYLCGTRCVILMYCLPKLSYSTIYVSKPVLQHPINKLIQLRIYGVENNYVL